MPDYFGEALQGFVKNFAWYGTVKHLHEQGYTPARMLVEGRVQLSEEEISRMIMKIEEEKRKK